MALTTVKSDQIQTSVALAGSPTTTTQSASDNSTKVATTAYADTAVANLVASAPASLNTLDELAAALNDDASFSTTVTNSIAAKLPLAGGTLTGGLGIGAAVSTGYQLQLTGQSGYDDILRLTAVGTNIGARINLTNTGTGIARVNATNNSLALQTGGTTALTLDSSQNATFAGNVRVSGNLGIGANASSVIGVYSTKSLANGLAAEFTNSESSTGSGIVVRGGNNSSTYSADFRDYNSNSLMRIRGDGNVGIGTGAPGYKLEVNGTAHVVNTLTAGAVGIPSQGITLNQGFGTGVPTMTMLGTAANGRAGAIIFQEQGASNTAAIYSTDGGTGNGAYGGLTIATYQSDLRFATNGLASTRMLIDSSGSVGIAITPKVTNSTVTGSLNVDEGGILVRNSNQAYFASNMYWDSSDQLKSHSAGYGIALGYIPSDGSYRFYNTTASASGANQNLTLAERVRIDTDGKVGIGTINPNSQLHVYGRLNHNITLGTTHTGASNTAHSITNTSIIGGKLRFSIQVYFQNGTSNLAIRIYANPTSLWFSGEVCIGSTYSNASATGLNRYSFSHNYNSGANYGNVLTQTESFGQVASHFTFHSHGWDSTESAHYFEFRHVASSGNTMFLQFEGNGSSPDHANLATWYYKHKTF